MSWIAAFFSILGLMLAARRIRLCWISLICASVCWIVYGWITYQWPILIVDTIALGFNYHGWLAWKPQTKGPNAPAPRHEATDEDPTYFCLICLRRSPSDHCIYACCEAPRDREAGTGQGPG